MRARSSLLARKAARTDLFGIVSRMTEEPRASTTDWRQVFEHTYSSAGSPVQERIWREVFGDEYPEGVDPYSFISRSELARFADEVRVGPGQTLVDLGCGRGGAGLWVAAATGAKLIGIDIAEAALVAARARATAMGSAATFHRGEFESTGLADGTADAIMSVDALLFTPSKSAAFTELRRILRPGRRLVMTSWDYHRQPVGRPPQVPDHRPLAENAGFDVVAYDTTDQWRERSEQIGQALLDAAEELAAESGETVEEVRASIAEMNATVETMTRRFFLVAEAR
jgi:ubiquinone/menaquinone biosynthesis C-methylase UbiE